MGNVLQDITEDGNVWDDERLKVSEDAFNDWLENPPDDDEWVSSPTFLVAPVADAPAPRGIARGGYDPSAFESRRRVSRRRAGCRKPDDERWFQDEQVSHRWTVELHRQGGDNLGLSMRVARNGRLEVTSVDSEGLVAAWNCASPSRALRAGDRILEVNGESVTDQISEALGCSGKLSIAVVRDEDVDEGEFEGGIRDPNQVFLQPGSGDTRLVRPRDHSPSASSSRAQQRRWAPLDECTALRGKVLLTPQRLSELHQFLPLTVRFASNWKLMYCPRIHGISLRTFYRQCAAWPSDTLFLVKDTEGVVFGGYASSPWKVQGERLHYGDPSCFVFSYGAEESPLLQVHPWAGYNEFFMFADLHGFSMGGGDSRNAIWIDKEFLRGTSAPSKTFGNTAPLASQQDFVITQFECWSFDCENFGSAFCQALVREHRGGTRDGTAALAAAFDNAQGGRGSPAADLLHDRERRRGAHDVELKEYASEALRYEAIA